MLQKSKSDISTIVMMLLLVVMTALLSSCAGRSGPMGGERFEMAKSQIMERWDLNRDGEITCDDATEKHAQKFVKADLNGDGLLDVAEFAEAPWSNRAFAAEHLGLYDLNHDRIISRQEFDQRPDGQFQLLDSNGNCSVSDREIVMFLSDGRMKNAGKRRMGKPGGKGGGGGQRRPQNASLG